MQKESTEHVKNPTIVLVDLIACGDRNLVAFPVHDSCDISQTRQGVKNSPDDFKSTLLNIVKPSHKQAILPIVDELRPQLHYRDSVECTLIHCNKQCDTCAVRLPKQTNKEVVNTSHHRFCEV